MNALSRISQSALRLQAAGVLGGALALAGCADLRRSVSLPPVNPESPVASIVEPASRGSYVTPRLGDVPPLPKNVPEAGAVKAGVLSMVRCRGGLERYPLMHPPLSRGTEQFASNARDVAQVNPADVPPPDSAARTDAFAAGLRTEVAPPPAIPSGPPLSADQGRPPGGSAPQRPSASAAARPPRRPAAAPPRPSAPPAAPAPVQTAAGPAPSARGVETNATPPSLPAPLPDPLLARCS